MTSSINPVVLKALISLPIVYILDNKVAKDSEMMGSAYFAVSASAGIYVGSMLGTTLTSYLPSVPPTYTGVMDRVSEIGLGVGSSWILNKYVLKNDAYGTTMTRVGIVAIADIASSLAVDYLSGQPLVIL